MINECCNISSIRQAKEDWKREIELFERLMIYKIPIKCTECKKIAPIIGKEYIDYEEALYILERYSYELNLIEGENKNEL